MNQSTIDQFLGLKFGNVTVACPYFINKGNKVRAALRVNSGKGTPEEITEEAKTLAMREGVNLKQKNADEIRVFLVDHNLGIDCSGLASQILQPKKLYFPHAKSLLRKVLVKMRPLENTSVEVLAHEKNSQETPLANVQIGDMIIMIGTGESHDLNHVLVITNINTENAKLKELEYVHSLQWKSDGKYGGGVRTGKILIEDISKPLTDQNWIEQEKDGQENETLWRAQTAQLLQVRRLNA